MDFMSVQSDQQDALFAFSLLQFVQISSTYLLIIIRYCIYRNWYILCVLCRLAASRVEANVSSKHVEAINRNKLKANSASCWSYYTDIQCVRKVAVHL
jgi:hypothetical protein